MGGGGAAARPGGNTAAAGAPTMGAAQAPRTGAAGNAGAAVGGGAGGFRGRSNILVERFLANGTFSAMYQKALSELRTELYASGKATEILNRWTELLRTQASDLVPAATLTQEAANISRNFTA
jgi:spore coat protein CotH